MKSGRLVGTELDSVSREEEGIVSDVGAGYITTRKTTGHWNDFPPDLPSFIDTPTRGS